MNRMRPECSSVLGYRQWVSGKIISICEQQEPEQSWSKSSRTNDMACGCHSWFVVGQLLLFAFDKWSHGLINEITSNIEGILCHLAAMACGCVRKFNNSPQRHKPWNIYWKTCGSFIAWTRIFQTERRGKGKENLILNFNKILQEQKNKQNNPFCWSDENQIEFPQFFADDLMSNPVNENFN